jgi:Flp pilus assembly protein TadB
MGRVTGYLLAALGILAAALLYMTGQRDKAKAQAKAARVNLQASEASREVDATARKAQEQARQQSAEVQRDADDRPDDRRPSGTLRR